MTAANDVLGSHNAGIDERALQVRQIVSPGPWSSCIERDVPALRANDYLIAADHSIGDGGTKSVAHCPLRSLATVIDRGIDDVDASLERHTNGGSVFGVVGVVALAQVGSDPERRGGQSAGKRPKEITGEAIGEPLLKPCSAGRARA